MFPSSFSYVIIRYIAVCSNKQDEGHFIFYVNECNFSLKYHERKLENYQNGVRRANHLWFLTLSHTHSHFDLFIFFFRGFPGGASGKESVCQCRRHRRCRFNPWVRKIPWSRKWQLIPIFLPGKFHGQRSLIGYSQWSCQESDTTEWLSTQLYH